MGTWGVGDRNVRYEITQGDAMEIDLQEIEMRLKRVSSNSIDDLLRYVLFEIQSPIEDYPYAIGILKEVCEKTKDVRIAILGAYLSFTWQSYKENVFIGPLRKCIENADSHHKAMIYYLLAYDLYMRCDNGQYAEMASLLEKSISFSQDFVNNYALLASISLPEKACELLQYAIVNIQKVWTDDAIAELPLEFFIDYNAFVNEFITGVDKSIHQYEELKKQRKRYLRKCRAGSDSRRDN